MTPQQAWFDLPLPGPRRPLRSATRRNRRHRPWFGVLIGTGAAALALLLLGGIDSRWASIAERDEQRADPAADAEAFLDAYRARGLPAGGRETVLQLGRAACAISTPAAWTPQVGGPEPLSPADAQQVHELALLHLCPRLRSG